MRKDIPGFIANRLQSALAREAMSLVQKSIAAPEDIGVEFKHSLALRMPFSGSLEQRDLNGLDTHHAVAECIRTWRIRKLRRRCCGIKSPKAS